MINQFISIFLISNGLLMIGLWTFFLINRDGNPELIQEFKETPYQIKLHLVAEYTTAITSIITGIFNLFVFSQFWILTPISLGMVLFASFQALISYTVEGEIPFILILIIITSLTFFAIILEISIGIIGEIQGTTLPSEILWIWVLTAISLGMTLYIIIQTIGYELHFGKGKYFDRHISFILYLVNYYYVNFISTLIL